MIQKILAFLGFKEYLVEIKWVNGEKEIVPMKAWSPYKAVVKISNLIDVTNKAELTILNHRKNIKFRSCRAECLGVAKKIDNKGR